MKNTDIDSNIEIILNELIKNSRITAKEIAEKIGLTRQTVSRIIKNLEEDKVIWGYSTVVSNSHRIKNYFVALIKTDDIEKLMKNVRDAILNKEKGKQQLTQLDKVNFFSASFFHGEYDLIISFYAPSLIEAKKVVSAIRYINHPNIIRIDLLQPLIIARKRGVINPKLIEEFKELGID